MADTSTPPIPAATMALVRQGILVIGSFAVGRGWVQADQIDGIATLLLTVGAAGWGLYKTFTRQKDIKKAEEVVGPLKQLP